MALSILSKTSQSFGSLGGAVGQVQLDNSYPTGGYPLTPQMFSYVNMSSFLATTTGGDILVYNYATQKLMAFTSSGGAGGATGSTTAVNATSAVTGTGTGTVVPLGSNSPAALNIATPLFSGTGLTAAGQTLTTTDMQTMGLNQCAGMWLLSATGATPPNLILSNTAVALAPAVFTVQGAASTDAGAYRVITGNSQLFTGSPSAVTVSALAGTAAAQIQTGHTHTVGASGGGLSEVANGTNLATVVANYVLMTY